MVRFLETNSSYNLRHVTLPGAMWSLIISSIITFVIPVWLVVELAFAVIFYQVLKKRFNRPTPPADYRDYARDRRKLLMRILKRLETNCRATNTPILPTIRSYVREWFHPVSPHNDNKSEFWPKKGDMDNFFAWAFFGVVSR